MSLSIMRSEKESLQELCAEMCSKIKTLPSHYQVADQVLDICLTLGCSTEPANREEAEDGVRICYQALGKKMPEILWALSPKKALGLLEGSSVKDFCFGQHDLYWIEYYYYLDKAMIMKLQGQLLQKLEGIRKISRNSGWYLPYEDVCILSERPSEMHFDENNKPHNESGPAIKYRDGFSVYCLHGVNVSKEEVESMKTLEKEDDK
jgi:hypothetical protein